MAELLAIHQDLKNLTPITTLESNGEASIKFTGSDIYKPELRLSKLDVSNIIKALSGTEQKSESVKAISYNNFSAISAPPASWIPYSAGSVFNMTAIDKKESLQSKLIIKKILSWGTPAALSTIVNEDNDYDHPIYWSLSSDPLVEIRTREDWAYNEIDGIKVHIPLGAKAAGGSDGHMCIVQPNGEEIDMWRASGIENGVLSCAWGGKLSITGEGVALHGATASDFGLLAGVIRPEEIIAGEINHALFIVVRNTKGIVHPATGNGSESNEPGVPPMGAHLRLNISKSEIKDLNLPGWKEAFVTAMAVYGGYIGDTGGPGFGFQLQSTLSYTAMGIENPLIAWAKKEKLPEWESSYIMDIASGIPWSKLCVVE